MLLRNKDTTMAQTSTSTVTTGSKQAPKRRMARMPATEPVAPSPAEEAAPAAPPKAKRSSKIAAVIALLQRGQGATLAELIEATSWLPHTTRAALTGLKKKGHVIDKAERGDATCYRIAEQG